MEKKLNSNMLKLAAILAMTLDHVLWVVFPGYDNGIGLLMLHCIGRITAPIMCFFVAEGYHYTHDLKKYLTRLFVFAVISHFAYNFAFGIPLSPAEGSVFNRTSIIWALFLGLLALAAAESKSLKPWQRTAAVIAAAVLAFPADWSSIAVMMIVYFGVNRGNFKKQMIFMLLWTAVYAAVYCVFIDVGYGLVQMYVILAIPLLYNYNGKRGKAKSMKWFFYWYYPLHLVLCGVLRLALHGNITAIVGG